VALLAALVAMWAAIDDVDFEDRTCGNALIATDPSALVVLSGDPALDDFEGQRLEGACRRRLQRRRFLILIPVAVAATATVAAVRTPDSRRR
jgi:hypothetical protein